MLKSKINGDIYYSIYELENWLRRICLNVYMIEYVETWLTIVPRRVNEGYSQRHNQNQELFYFDADDEDNLIWSLTSNSEAAYQFSQERFSKKLNDLREIRNILAHNRAYLKE